MGEHAGVFLTAGFPVPVPAPCRRSLPIPRAAPGAAAPLEMRGWRNPGCSKGSANLSGGFPDGFATVLPAREGLQGSRDLEQSRAASVLN